VLLQKEKIKRFNTGEIVFSIGEVAEHIYIIKKGRVQVFLESDSKKTILRTLGPGEPLGEMAVLCKLARSASVIAIEPCEMEVISGEGLLERLENADPVIRLLFFNSLARVRHLSYIKAGVEQPDWEPSPDIMDSDSTKKQNDEIFEIIRLESDLKSALNKNELNLEFQPIVNMSDRKIAGFEALIRWNCPTRGKVRPDIFMELAEETSLAIPIGNWVIEKSCEALAQIEEKMSQIGMANKLFMSINISGKQLQNQLFIPHLKKTIQKNNLSPSSVKLEVTERILLGGITATFAINKARSFGCSVALDDFGTGYSSLSYLADFNINNLKIDQSFVKKISCDPKTLSITKGIALMSHEIGLSIIAEGIEEDGQFQTMRDMGCQYGQGYLFSKPVPLEEVFELIEKPRFEKGA
jgi:EAL domain-containing protein (putative c-di-GMP-specific phosphodiesterase class I)